MTRIRPGLIFQAGQGSQVGRYFLGPLVPLPVTRLRPPVLPLPRQFVFQAVHTDDVAEAYWLAVRKRAAGAFNIAAEPVLTPARVAGVLGAWAHVDVPLSLFRSAVWLSWVLRLQRTDPGWIDMAAHVPIMSTRRAEEELGWVPVRSSVAALQDVIEGMRHQEGVTGSPSLRP